MSQVTWHVPNISCHHCVRTIERELATVEGLAEVHANAESKTVTLAYQDEQALQKAKDLLAEIGYPVAG
ncbi:MAG: heavy-metal-associated domain-containing protein [Chloroflexi bacterium]|nr:heavy-metal-associated domain-containing protein [Chloroflexota bacterium]